jgi:hypothetical protein
MNQYNIYFYTDTGGYTALFKKDKLFVDWD